MLCLLMPQGIYFPSAQAACAHHEACLHIIPAALPCHYQPPKPSAIWSHHAGHSSFMMHMWEAPEALKPVGGPCSLDVEAEGQGKASIQELQKSVLLTFHPQFQNPLVLHLDYLFGSVLHIPYFLLYGVNKIFGKHHSQLVTGRNFLKCLKAKKIFHHLQRSSVYICCSMPSVF